MTPFGLDVVLYISFCTKKWAGMCRSWNKFGFYSKDCKQDDNGKEYCADSSDTPVRIFILHSLNISLSAFESAFY